MEDKAHSESLSESESRPNLGMRYRTAAIILGFLGIVASLILLLVSALGSGSIAGPIFLFVVAFAFLYIGITGNQRSWVAKFLEALGWGFQ